MQSTYDFVVNRVLETYSELISSKSCNQSWTQLSEEEIWHHLCLCILSSNVDYDLAYSAFQYLKSENLLSTDFLTNNRTAQHTVSNQLSQSRYLPKKKNGDMRKYRFPKRRAKDIVDTAIKLYRNGQGLTALLVESKSDYNLRDFLAGNLSGIGLKQASHFLRNIGFSDSLAIVDTHIIRFLRETQGLKIESNKAITRKQYLVLEGVLQEMCELMQINMGIFDSAIWRYMRGK